jgi:hypothetical protein
LPGARIVQTSSADNLVPALHTKLWLTFNKGGAKKTAPARKAASELTFQQYISSEQGSE